jgi:hypothetical protein
MGDDEQVLCTDKPRCLGLVFHRGCCVGFGTDSTRCVDCATEAEEEAKRLSEAITLSPSE